MKTSVLPFLLLAVQATAAPLSKHSVGNVNRYLANSARTDLIGPEMWTCPKEVSGDRVSRPDQ